MFGNIQTYYIYENWVAHGHVAKIHKGDCSFCNEGKGIHGTDNRRHGQWLGPYTSFTDALQAAKKTRADISTCKVCGPESDNF